MQSHTEIEVAITCQAFSHHLPSLREGFSLSFKFRHTRMHAHGCQILGHIRIQGWVDGNHLLLLLISLFCSGNYLAVQGTAYTFSKLRSQPCLQLPSLPACPIPPPPRFSAPRILQAGVFTSLPSLHSQCV